MGIFSFLSTLRTPARPERRTARRHQPLFQASWRLLGDRTNTYYPAHVKDISATGIALQMPATLELKAEAIIMVQLDDVPPRFAGPWLARILYLERQSDAVLAGCAFSSPFKEEDCQIMLKAVPRPRSDGSGHRRESYDPFVHGSPRERRRTPRRRGSAVAVHLRQSDQSDQSDNAIEIAPALVLDRSFGGLALQSAQEFTQGATVDVRPVNAPEEVPWIQIVIRHCQAKGGEWLLGCEFVKTPPSHAMLHFG